jgi:two-component system nitrate/nitrite response regulator NarL
MSALVQSMVHCPPAVLLLSIEFPGLGAASGIRGVRQLSPGTKIIVLSQSVNEAEELEVLRMGAKGYCGLVEADVLLKMVDKVQHGEVWAGRKTIGALLEDFYGGVSVDREQTVLESQLQHLTARERAILRLLAEGASNKEIANALNVAVSTIKAHLTKIFRKLGQTDRLRLALYASAGRPRLLAEVDRADV